MGRIGLALVVLIGLGAVAHASRIECARPFGESAFVGDDLPVPISVKLDPDPHPGDKTPPEPPTDARVSVAVEGGVTKVSVEGTFAPDTAYIRVAFDGYFFITMPDRTYVCIHHEVKPGARARIVVMDASQNQTPSLTVYTQALEEQRSVPPHHDRHGMEILIFIGAIVLSGCIFICLILIGMARKKAPYSVAGELLSPILAENVARLVARGYLIKLAGSLAITLGLATLHHPYIAILVAPFPVVWLFEVFMTRLVLSQFDSKIQRLEKRENWIYINSSKLYAPYKIWEKASALPSATLSSRD